MPSANEILSAFTKYTPRTNRALGYWVGVAPRITRRPQTGYFETTVAWLYAWDDTAYTRQNWAALKERIRSAVQDGLDELSYAESPLVESPLAGATGWVSLQMPDYSPAINGPVTWWQSGEAARTRTRDEAPTGFGRLDVPENPVGPTSAETHPTTLTETIPNVLTRTVSGPLGTIGPWVIGGLFLYGVIQYARARA